MSKPNTRRVVRLAAVSAIAMMVLYNPPPTPARVLRHQTPASSSLLGAWMAFIPDRDLAPVRLVVWGIAHRLAGAAARQERREQSMTLR